MYDYLALLPSTFAAIATWLTRQVGPWWPLWIGAVFPVYAAVLSFMVWIFRGRLWPVRCLYPWTQQKWPCENWVAGEWYRCHVHNEVKRYKHHGGHWVDPNIKRWQIGDYSTGLLVDRPVDGVGFIRIHPASHALLYRNGYARRPGDVILGVPNYIKESFRRARTVHIQNPAATGAEDSVILGSQGVRDATARQLLTVVPATRFSLVVFGFALAASLIAIFVPPTWQSLAQWLGTLGFVIAWSGLSAGIWQQREDWLSGACWKALKWWLTVFLPIALLNLFNLLG